MICSVVKHLGCGEAFMNQRETLDYVSSIPQLHFFRALASSCKRTLQPEQSTVEDSLLVN